MAQDRQDETLNAEHMRLQIRQAQLNIMREEKQNAQAEEVRTQTLAFKKMNADAFAKDRADSLAIQAACMHIKPNLRTALAGQRDHHRSQHLICQYCGKTFTDNEVTQYLQPDYQLVGGPL